MVCSIYCLAIAAAITSVYRAARGEDVLWYVLHIVRLAIAAGKTSVFFAGGPLASGPPRLQNDIVSVSGRRKHKKSCFFFFLFT